MNAKHTPGKWNTSKLVNDIGIYADGSNRDLALVYKYSRSIPEEEAQANANLMAAAPELLEALQKAKEVIERMSDEFREVAGRHASYSNGEAKIIEAAINKATNP